MSPSHKRLSSVALPILALALSMASIQTGASIAQRLFPLVGPQGATALRLALAALILLAIRQPSLKGLTGGQIKAIVLYGASLGAMNLLFYIAIRTIPLGIAVAVEFTGPLVVAALSQRSRWDIVWLLLAAAGLVALAPFGQGHAAPDAVGLMLALGAGLFWGLYILFGQKAGEAGSGAATGWGMAAGACLVVPVGLAHAGVALFDPKLLPLALTVAVLSSAVPYTLEMFALTRMPKATFGTLMSLEPVVGSLAGWLILGQTLTLRQGLAIAGIMAASAGATATFAARRRSEPLPPTFALD